MGTAHNRKHLRTCVDRQRDADAGGFETRPYTLGVLRSTRP